MGGGGRIGTERSWPAWAWMAVPLLGLGAAAVALVSALLLYELLLGATGDLWGFLCGPLTFLWAGWAGWRAAAAGWRWPARPATGGGPRHAPGTSPGTDDGGS